MSVYSARAELCHRWEIKNVRYRSIQLVKWRAKNLLRLARVVDKIAHAPSPHLA